jgi:hypothetical protein
MLCHLNQSIFPAHPFGINFANIFQPAIAVVVDT